MGRQNSNGAETACACIFPLHLEQKQQKCQAARLWAIFSKFCPENWATKIRPNPPKGSETLQQQAAGPSEKMICLYTMPSFQNSTGLDLEPKKTVNPNSWDKTGRCLLISVTIYQESITHRIHRTGIFAYIYHKHQPFM